jgi:hypothetical protein
MTDLSRRTLLAGSALGAAVAPFLGGSAHAAKPARAYSRARFAPMVRKRFRVRGPGGRWSARLLAVTDLNARQRGEDQAFGLLLRSRRRGPAEGIFVLERNRFAPVELFLVPTDDRRRTYYAVVNRAS